MANEKTVKLVSKYGGFTDPKFVVADISFDSNGDATVTAASLGLSVIYAVLGAPQGGTTNAVAAVYQVTAYAAAGNASVALEARESDAGTDADLNITSTLVFVGA